MQIKELYKYEREPGKFTVSTYKPDCPYEVMYRIIADEGKLVTQNGIDGYCVTDVFEDNKEGWFEIIDPDYQEIIDIIE